MATFAISEDALNAFRENQETIIDDTVERALAKREDVEHHGPDAERVIRAGLEYTSRMLDAVLTTGEAALMEQQLRWAQSRLPHDGVQPEHILSRLRIYRAVVQEVLPEKHAGEITRVLDWMIERHQEIQASDD